MSTTPAPGAPRTLVVLRHAKAEQSGPSDVERALAERGWADARAQGAWLAARGVRPGLALVSAARRTAETWQALAQGAGWTLEPVLDRGLYAAGPDTVLDVLAAMGGDAATVVVVGHNPTMAWLAQSLDDGSGDPAAAMALASDYPTCTASVFEVDCTWADLPVTGARLVAVHTARA